MKIFKNALPIMATMAMLSVGNVAYADKFPYTLLPVDDFCWGGSYVISGDQCGEVEAITNPIKTCEAKQGVFGKVGKQLACRVAHDSPTTQTHKSRPLGSPPPFFPEDAMRKFEPWKPTPTNPTPFATAKLCPGSANCPPLPTPTMPVDSKGKPHPTR